MTYLIFKYQYRWWNHPHKDRLQEEADFMLNVLARTEEIAPHDRLGKEITGKGILAIAEYEENERKHKEAMGLQRWIVLLTVVLAITPLSPYLSGVREFIEGIGVWVQDIFQ